MIAVTRQEDGETILINETHITYIERAYKPNVWEGASIYWIGGTRPVIVNETVAQIKTALGL